MSLKVTLGNIGGKVLRDNEQYVVEDNSLLNNLTLSKTTLHPEKATNGHKHDGLEEIYIFLGGRGEIQVGEAVIPVAADDVILIPAGDFHKVSNQSADEDLVFLSIFQAYDR